MTFKGDILNGRWIRVLYLSEINLKLFWDSNGGVWYYYPVENHIVAILQKQRLVELIISNQRHRRPTKDQFQRVHFSFTLQRNRCSCIGSFLTLKKHVCNAIPCGKSLPVKVGHGHLLFCGLELREAKNEMALMMKWICSIIYNSCFDDTVDLFKEIIRPY